MNFRQWFVESKQSIINLRFPEIVAKLLYEKFGKHAPLIAKWFREYRFSGEIPNNWWLQTTSDYNRTPSLYDLTVLYDATESPEKYKQALDKLELSREPTDMSEERKLLKAQIESRLFQDTFFIHDIVKDILSGKLKDLSPYKHLRFWDAQYKYDEKKIFREKIPLKTYKNGFKWINVGKRCDLVGKLMKNCGSAGLMSLDDDRTMIVLFGPDNVGHVVVTYSPNEKRISGDQGVASTIVKDKYHSYVLDLANMLGAVFDADKTQSKLLKMKYLLQNKAKGLRKIGEEHFMFSMGGETYYSNGYVIVSKRDIDKVLPEIRQGIIKLDIKQRSLVSTVLNHRNQPILARVGVRYIPLRDL